MNSCRLDLGCVASHQRRSQARQSIVNTHRQGSGTHTQGWVTERIKEIRHPLFESTDQLIPYAVQFPPFRVSGGAISGVSWVQLSRSAMRIQDLWLSASTGDF